MKTIYTLLFLSFTSAFAAHNTAIQWQKSFGGSGNDDLISMQQTHDGGYILGGFSNSGMTGNKTNANKGGMDYWVIKTDPFGVIQWQKDYGGTGDDFLRVVKQTWDGGYILGGYSSSGISGDKTEASHGGSDFWVLKLNKAGEIIWQKTIGGSQDEVLFDLSQISDTGFICGGYSYSDISGDKTEPSRGSSDYWVVRLSANGTLMGQKTFGGNDEDNLYSVSQTSDGGYILGGQSKSGMWGDKTENGQGDWDYWVIKTDAVGNIEWQNTIGGSGEDHLISSLETKDGEYILGGSSFSPVSGDKDVASYNGNADLWLVKLKHNGDIRWQKTISGDLWDQIYNLIPTPDGGYLLGANTVSNVFNDKTDPLVGGEDYWVIKTDSLGNIEWQNDIGGNNDEQLFAVQQTIDGGFILAGYSASGISGDKTSNNYGYEDYWVVKLIEDPRFINGNIFADFNQDCISNNSDRGVKNFSVQAKKGNAFAFTTSGDSGRYSLAVVDTGRYTIELLPNDIYPFLSADACNPSQVNVSGSAVNLNLGLKPDYVCPYNTVNVSSGSLFRKCVPNTYTVAYQNNGAGISQNTYIDLTLDRWLHFDSATIAYTSLGNNTYRFSVGDLDFLKEGSFAFSATPDCDSSETGQTLCVEAHIYPDTVCLSSVYTGSYIIASAACLGDSVQLTLINSGSAMQQSQEYFVVANDNEILHESYQLTQNAVLVKKFPADSGKTYRIIAARENNFPPALGDPYTTAAVEGCTTSWPSYSTGYYTLFPNYDGEPSRSVNCNTIISSFDPNDKVAIPEGYAAAHFIEANTDIEYVINFQNTGNDTAFKIIIVDTISSKLDINSIQPVGASHPYKFERINANVVRFVFNSIKLVDSIKNERLSHGFVKFRISQKANNALGTKIYNMAAIYFDYNAPVLTNTTYHTIGKDFVRINLATLTKNPLFNVRTVKAYPNPFGSVTQILVESDLLKNPVLLLMDINGKVIRQINATGQNKFDINRADLASGTYIYKILQGNETIATGKLIAE